jgi:hypothetical protein
MTTEPSRLPCEITMSGSEGGDLRMGATLFQWLRQADSR